MTKYRDESYKYYLSEKKLYEYTLSKVVDVRAFEGEGKKYFSVVQMQQAAMVAAKQLKIVPSKIDSTSRTGSSVMFDRVDFHKFLIFIEKLIGQGLFIKSMFLSKQDDGVVSARVEFSN
ncbi:type II secretion system protein GspM [Pseudomonas luteola]|uniref:type II secretion system protein GspM n=1 Tax=Pseudomonas luteola TaxID=47886 RepID=UPI00388E500C